MANLDQLGLLEVVHKMTSTLFREFRTPLSPRPQFPYTRPISTCQVLPDHPPFLCVDVIYGRALIVGSFLTLSRSISNRNLQKGRSGVKTNQKIWCVWDKVWCWSSATRPVSWNGSNTNKSSMKLPKFYFTFINTRLMLGCNFGCCMWCILAIWIFKLPFLLNPFEQMLQTCAFVSEWTDFVCTFSVDES